MPWDGFACTPVCVDVVISTASFQIPAVSLKKLDEVAVFDGYHLPFMFILYALNTHLSILFTNVLQKNFQAFRFSGRFFLELDGEQRCAVHISKSLKRRYKFGSKTAMTNRC